MPFHDGGVIPLSKVRAGRALLLEQRVSGLGSRLGPPRVGPAVDKAHKVQGAQEGREAALRWGSSAEGCSRTP